MMVCSIADAYHISPSQVRSWGVSDIQLMQKYWKFQQMKRDEATATDSPSKMAEVFGSM